MKSFYTFFLFFLLFIPYNSSFAQDSTAVNKVEKISLKMNLEPNTSYRFINNSTQKIVQDFMGNTMEINQRILMNYIFEIESNTGEEMKIKTIYERLAFDIEMPQGSLTIDSEKEENDGDNHLSSRKLSEIVNKPFYIYLSSEGRITKIEGLTELVNEEKNINQLILKEFLSERNLISAIENSFNIFSKDSISMGDTWNKSRSRSINNQFNLSFEESFTLESLSEDLAWINIETPIKASVSENSLFDSFTIAGTQEGTIEVDRNSGLILFSETKQELQGFIKMQEMEIPVQVSSMNIHNGEKL